MAPFAADAAFRLKYCLQSAAKFCRWCLFASVATGLGPKVTIADFCCLPGGGAYEY
jgi:hypothetical protein